MPDHMQRWVRRVLRLYPYAWRERYYDELLHVIEQQPVTLWTLGDFLLGAIDARLHPYLIPRRLIAMQQQLRTSAIALFIGIVLFGLAWAGVLQVRDPLPAWVAVTRHYPATLAAFDVAQVMGPLAILAFCVGGIRIVWSALGDALAQRRRGVLLAILAVGAAIVGMVLFALFALNASTVRVAPGDTNASLTPWAFVLQMLLLALVLLAIVGTVTAVALAIARTEVDLRAMRFALVPVGIGTAAMAVGTFATILLMALGFQDAPQIAPGDLVVPAMMMMGGMLLAVVGLRRSIQVMRQPRRSDRANPLPTSAL